MTHLLDFIAALLGLILHDSGLNLWSLEEVNGHTVNALVELIDGLDIVPSVVGHTTIIGVGEGRTHNADKTSLS